MLFAVAREERLMRPVSEMFRPATKIPFVARSKAALNSAVPFLYPCFTSLASTPWAILYRFARSLSVNSAISGNLSSSALSNGLRHQLQAYAASSLSCASEPLRTGRHGHPSSYATGQSRFLCHLTFRSSASAGTCPASLHTVLQRSLLCCGCLLGLCNGNSTATNSPIARSVLPVKEHACTSLLCA